MTVVWQHRPIGLIFYKERTVRMEAIFLKGQK